MTQRRKLTEADRTLGTKAAAEARTRQRLYRTKQATMLYAQGWSKARIARRLGVSTASITNYLRDSDA